MWQGKGKVKSQREPLLNYAITGTHHTDTQGHTAAHSTDHYCRLDTAAEEASNQDEKKGKELEMERSKGRRNEKEEEERKARVQIKIHRGQIKRGRVNMRKQPPVYTVPS